MRADSVEEVVLGLLIGCFLGLGDFMHYVFSQGTYDFEKVKSN